MQQIVRGALNWHNREADKIELHAIWKHKEEMHIEFKVYWTLDWKIKILDY